MDLRDLFKKYLGEDIRIDPDLLRQFDGLTEQVELKRGQKIVREGVYSQYAYLIIKGSARSYNLRGGIEIVNWFALEDELAVSMDNYMGRMAKESVVFMEESQCLRLDMQKWKQLEKTELIVANLSIKLLEDYVSFIDTHARHLANPKGIERYRYLLKENPEYFLRIPITHLASYLGMSRENLSRLRKKEIL